MCVTLCLGFHFNAPTLTLDVPRKQNHHNHCDRDGVEARGSPVPLAAKVLTEIARPTRSSSKRARGGRCRSVRGNREAGPDGYTLLLGNTIPRRSSPRYDQGGLYPVKNFAPSRGSFPPPNASSVFACIGHRRGCRLSDLVREATHLLTRANSLGAFRPRHVRPCTCSVKYSMLRSGTKLLVSAVSASAGVVR